MPNEIRIEYSYFGKDDTRRMSRGFKSTALAADFMRNLYATRNESLTLLVNGKEFSWPEDTSDEETLRKHLEYCLGFVEAFYDE